MSAQAPSAVEHPPPDGPDVDYRLASRAEAVKALEQNRRVYARESLGRGWGRVASVENLLDQGRRTPAFRVRFVSGHVRAALDGDFLIERERR